MFLRLLLGGCLTAAVALGASAPVERIQKAHRVFNEIMDNSDQAIPEYLLERAHCVVIIPGLKKGGFIVGGKFGKGLAMCRGVDKTGWGGPSMVRVEGGSFGLQIGGGEVDVVMLVMNEGGVEKLAKTEFTVGGEAGVMAGPVGRSAEAETDALMHAQILSYSRSRGVFAGIALDGSTLRADRDENQQLYGTNVTHKDILMGQVPAPNAAASLIETLSQWSFQEKGE